MSKVIDESDLRLTFDDPWDVEKYDDHRDYRRGIEKLKGKHDGKLRDTSAIDIIGTRGKLLAFIELKDFRGHRIATKGRVGADLALEVAYKARDSIAGIMGAFHTSDSPETWRPAISALSRQDVTVFVVLWLEEDHRFPSAFERKRHKNRQSVLNQELKRKCSWLTTKSFVTNYDGFNKLLPGVRATRR